MSETRFSQKPEKPQNLRSKAPREAFDLTNPVMANGVFSARPGSPRPIAQGTTIFTEKREKKNRLLLQRDQDVPASWMGRSV